MSLEEEEGGLRVIDQIARHLADLKIVTQGKLLKSPVVVSSRHCSSSSSSSSPSFGMPNLGWLETDDMMAGGLAERKPLECDQGWSLEEAGRGVFALLLQRVVFEPSLLDS